MRYRRCDKWNNNSIHTVLRLNSVNPNKSLRIFTLFVIESVKSALWRPFTYNFYSHAMTKIRYYYWISAYTRATLATQLDSIIWFQAIQIMVLSWMFFDEHSINFTYIWFHTHKTRNAFATCTWTIDTYALIIMCVWRNHRIS